MKFTKVQNAWCMYDWSNSVYSLVITSSIFPVYYSAVTKNPATNNFLTFFGLSFKNSVWYSYSLSATFLIVALLSPFLSALSDHLGKKKIFLQFFCALGSSACLMLYWFDSLNIGLGLLMFVIAGIGYSSSIVFYNSYLPIIAKPDQYDRLSAKGFSLGYIGSVILLIFNLSMILFPSLYGNIENGTACKISFLSVGIWWLFFGLSSSYYLPSEKVKKIKEKSWILGGFKELVKVFKIVKNEKQIKRFLYSFFFFNMGVQTIMYVATIFAEQTLHLESGNLIATILILQLVAIPGAIVFANLSSKYGNVNILLIMIAVWIMICLAAYLIKTDIQFYILASVVGFVMGGIQSSARATYSKYIPTDTTITASYYSYFDITDKFSVVTGTFFYGLIETLTGNARNSCLGLAVMFLISIVLLYRLRKVKSINHILIN